jgi:hypothetical protein
MVIDIGYSLGVNRRMMQAALAVDPPAPSVSISPVMSSRSRRISYRANVAEEARLAGTNLG